MRVEPIPRGRYINRLQHRTTVFKDVLFSSYLTYHWMFDKYYTTGATIMVRELFTLQEHLSWRSYICGALVVKILIFTELFYRSWFFLSLFIWPFYFPIKPYGIFNFFPLCYWVNSQSLKQSLVDDFMIYI